MSAFVLVAGFYPKKFSDCTKNNCFVLLWGGGYSPHSPVSHDYDPSYTPPTAALQKYTCLRTALFQGLVNISYAYPARFLSPHSQLLLLPLMLMHCSRS